ncbi:MAG: bifunctional demethylmenaquinone methyltransferase/2-methoxy-6-polyprenyl-1,4-benzoquinol methylase UbiE [Hyphomicrobiaceae bacterium]|nr:bifunctional demethylmenaquinone methyltransferase/2-methoxy-6-polyprenyl-1,4-benzoquinol methylase UbiE [Hyphomicrobiaceae bacterium]
MTKDRTNTAGMQNSFGFRDIHPNERQHLVNNVFSSVSDSYDFMNDLMSGGLHRLWKDSLICQLNPPKSSSQFKILDVAGGTGDIAIRAMKQGGKGCTAIIYDISSEMLDIGRHRVSSAGLSDRVDLVEGNAERLPFQDCHFDAYTISFGIRNVTRIDHTLQEAYRVLKPGGHFICLEFSKVTVPMLDYLYDFHSFKIIPRLGQWAANDWTSYRYLVESIRKFPTQDRFSDLISSVGFEQISHYNLTGGIVAIHSAWRI